MNRYDLAYCTIFPFFYANALVKRARHGKYRESLPAMLGKRLPAQPLPPARVHRCWMHTVSVGETIAAGAVFRELRRRDLGWEFFCTTTTETGQAQARQTMAEADAHTYVPADFSWLVRRFYEAYSPTLYLFFETELWPNLLLEGGRRSVPIFLVNGSLSARSAARYERHRGIFRRPLAQVRRFFMQTQQDAERLERVIGAGDDRIEVTGNVKFDALPEPLSREERDALRQRWGAGPDTVVVLAGSTHPGEEEIVREAFAQLRAAHGDSLLVVAPRHPERFDAVAEDFAHAGLAVHRTSRGANPAPARDTGVVLLDEMRVLARSYGAAEVALVAGSWAPIGGHNLLEAAVHGIPVLRGPHMHAQQDIVRVLGPVDGAPEVPAERLGAELVRLASQPDERRRLGEAAARAANSNRGAARRVTDRLLELIAAGG